MNAAPVLLPRHPGVPPSARLDPALKKATSVYLDLVRFAAASVVLVGHLSGARFTEGLMWQASRFMGEAVVVFFVLSGFVISHATQHRDRTASAFALSRMSRILSVAVPALMLTFVLDSLGRSLRPELYSAAWGYRADGRMLQLLANLCFVNQIWFLDVAPGSDLPYWSLGFEVWYYVIFGLFVFARARVLWAGLACLLAGPKILCMLPLWLLGVLAHKLCRQAVPRAAGWLLWLGCLAAWVSADAAHRRGGWPASWWWGPLARLDLPHSYLVGVLFAVNLIALDAVAADLDRLARRVEAPIRWLAGATFSLYLFHLPVAQCIAALLPWGPGTMQGRAGVVLGTVAAVFLLAELSERRKRLWRELLRRRRP